MDSDDSGASGSRCACADPVVASKASDPLKIKFRAKGVMTSFPINPSCRAACAPDSDHHLDATIRSRRYRRARRANQGETFNLVERTFGGDQPASASNPALCLGTRRTGQAHGFGKRGVHLAAFETRSRPIEARGPPRAWGVN
jgi:hypothetical protein